MVQNSIESYKESNTAVEEEVTIEQKRYLQLDCSPLKVMLSIECSNWQNKILDLTHSIARDELAKLRSFFKTNTANLEEIPKNDLEQLIRKIELVKKLRQEVQRNKAKVRAANDE